MKEASGLYVYSIRLCLLLYIPAGILLILSVMLHRYCGLKDGTDATRIETTHLRTIEILAV